MSGWSAPRGRLGSPDLSGVPASAHAADPEVDDPMLEQRSSAAADTEGRPASDAAGSPVTRNDGSRNERPSHGRRRPRLALRQGHVTAATAALAIALIALVFAGALSDAGVVNEHAAAVRAENLRLQERLDAGRREVTLIQGEAFVRLQARAYGFGEPGERAFALAPGAPAPATILPLGYAEQVPPPTTPLEDWLELLFGR